jgi:sugar-specific transcriptional regulator TrmB
MEHMAIHQTLKKIGLSDKEIKVYLALLKNGPAKPAALATSAKLNRATLYSIAQGLIAKGIIAEDLSGKSAIFAPLPPAGLEKILSAAKQELKQKENLINDAISELSLISSDKQYPVPKIRFIEENNLEKFLFDNLEKWQDEIIAADGVWWGYQDHTFAADYEDWLDQTWKTAQSRDDHYRAQFFINASETEHKLHRKYANHKRQVKYLDNTNFTASTWVCGDYLVMIMTQHHPYYLIEIHDRLLAQNTKEIFKKLWHSLAVR